MSSSAAQKPKTANHLHGTLGASTVTNSPRDGRGPLRDGDWAPRVSGGTAIAPKTGWLSEGLLMATVQISAKMMKEIIKGTLCK